jgi:hypothetical protein
VSIWVLLLKGFLKQFHPLVVTFDPDSYDFGGSPTFQGRMRLHEVILLPVLVRLRNARLLGLAVVQLRTLVWFVPNL